MTSSRWIARLLASALLASVPVLACQPRGSTRAGAAPSALRDARPIFAEAALPAVGTAAPGFDVPRLEGGRVALDSLLGRPVLLALWSTGCVRSREAVAVVDRLHRRFRDRGVTTVLLADDADRALVRRVLQQDGLTVENGGVVVGLTNGRLRSLFDRASDVLGDPALAPYRVEFVAPGFLLLDRAGVIRRRGAITLYADAFAASLDSLLAPSSGGGL